MGCEKATLVLGGRTFLERAVAAAGERRTAVVASPSLVAALHSFPGIIAVVNDAPELGMSYSLALANAALGRASEPLAVLLVDTPLVDAPLLDAVAGALDGADVAYPVREGRRGHPVVFGPRARVRIATLPAGDTLRRLRDDLSLSRRELSVTEDGPFIDVDTVEAFEALRERTP